MFCAGGHNLNPCGIDAAMAQNVRQLGNIFFNAVKGAGKEFAQIMGKYFAGFYSGDLAEPFHLCPDIAAVDRLSIPGDENRPGLNLVFLCILLQ